MNMEMAVENTQLVAVTPTELIPAQAQVIDWGKYPFSVEGGKASGSWGSQISRSKISRAMRLRIRSVRLAMSSRVSRTSHPPTAHRADLLVGSVSAGAGGMIRKGVLPRKDYPPCLQRSLALKGVFLGGCVARGVGSSFRAKAHAHTKGAHKGWLCIRKPERLSDTALLIHELAHIVTGQGHTDTWRAMVLKLGGTLDETPALKSYHKR